MSKKSIVIATRESALALWQAKHVAALLRDHDPDCEVNLLGMTTRGDKILDKKLSKVGGKGLFVKELEEAMLRGEAHLAVHSLKDVPMELPEGFVLAAITEREDPRDAFVSSKFASLDAMPAGAVVGTSSLRRELMIRSHYPKLTVKSVRGNVGTRLSKLDAGQYDALVMAGAGLKRLGFAERIRAWINPDVSLPSPGQGALGIEVRGGDSQTLDAVSFLNDAKTRAACEAERAVSRALGGSCQVPLAAYATVLGENILYLRALVGNHKTGETLSASLEGSIEKQLELANEVVNALRSQGADDLLNEVLRASEA